MYGGGALIFYMIGSFVEVHYYIESHPESLKNLKYVVWT